MARLIVKVASSDECQTEQLEVTFHARHSDLAAGRCQAKCFPFLNRQLGVLEELDYVLNLVSGSARLSPNGTRSFLLRPLDGASSEYRKRRGDSG